MYCITALISNFKCLDRLRECEIDIREYLFIFFYIKFNYIFNQKWRKLITYLLT